MNVDDLWIGDRLRTKSSRLTGTFEGLQGNRVRLKTDQGIILVPQHDLEPAPEPNEEDEVWEQGHTESGESPATFHPEIDLHLDLWPQYRPNHWATALDFQLMHCKKFLDQAVQHRASRIVIIHGKGAGILKDQVCHLLGDYPQVYQQFEINRGGALEVWMRPV